MPELNSAAREAADALVREMPASLRPASKDVKALAITTVGAISELYLDGEVGYEITARAMSVALEQADGGDVLIYINSPGGSAFEGLACFNTLLRYPGRKVVVIEGMAASAATFIAMAGDEIQMNEASFMMIHNSSGLTLGTSDDHADTMAFLEKVDAMQATIYAARTGLPEDDIRAMMAAETWMTGREAVEQGFATTLIEMPRPNAATALSPRASAVVRAFAHAPSAVLAMATGAPPATPSTPPAPPAHPSQENTMSGTAQDPAAGGTSVPSATPVVVNVPPTGTEPATLAQLQGIAARAKLNSDWVVAQMVAKATEDQARDAAIDAIAAAQVQRPGIIGAGTPTVDTNKAIVAAIAKRGGVKDPAKIAAAGPMDGLSMHDMAADFYEARTGKRARMPTAQLYREVFAAATVGMQTSGDFGTLLGQSIEAIVIDNAQRVSQEWRKIGRVYSFDNFRQRDVAGAFDAPDLEEVLEHEEIRYGAIQRALGKLGLKTFAKGFAFSRQAIINNDLTQFTADGATYGAMAARSLSARVWRIFQLGTTSAYNMTDGNPFLHTSHNNVAATPSAITEASLITASNALATQAAVAGKPLGLAARYLIVGTGRRFEAQKLMASLKMSDNTDNVFNGAFEIVYEPSFPTNAWALMADPDLHPIIAVSVLNGRETPEVVTEASFDTFGLKVRVSLDYEAAPIDWNGVYYNAGV